MRKASVFVIGTALLFLLTGCDADAPKMPSYETSAGRACGKKCQEIYNQCIIGAMDYALEREEKKKQECTNKLKACYDSCKADDKK